MSPSRFAPLAAVLLLLSGAPAFAHAHLQSATPAVDSVTAKAPAQVEIAFTEKLEGPLSRIVVKDAAGNVVDAGDTRLSGASGKALAVGLKPLAAGRYTVEWTATSVDTHRTTGSFTFTLKP